MRLLVLLILLARLPLVFGSDPQDLPGAQSPNPPSISLLLAKGVYAEETRGDLDEAITCYRRILDAGNGQRALEAEVLCRLGSCYERKHDISGATTCFTDLLTRYPEQAQYVVVANDFFASQQHLLPVPFPDQERLTFRIFMNPAETLGREWYWTAAGNSNGRKTLQFDRLEIGPTSIYAINARVNAGSLLPLGSELRVSGSPAVDNEFKPGLVETRTSGSTAVKTVEFKGIVYDSAEFLYLLRLLPLEVGFKWNGNLYSGFDQTAVVPFSVSVDALEKVTVPAGTWDCYRITTSLRQTIWIAKTPTRPWIKWQGDYGSEELESIDAWSPGEIMHYHDSGTGIHFDTPPGWRTARLDSWDFEHQMTVISVDPVSLSGMAFSRRGLDDLKAKEVVSARAWAQSRLAVDSSDTGKSNFKVRNGSFADRTIDGHAAVVYLADYAVPAGQMVFYSVFVFDKGSAISFRFSVPTSDFEHIRPELEAVLDSFHIDGK